MNNRGIRPLDLAGVQAVIINQEKIDVLRPLDNHRVLALVPLSFVFPSRMQYKEMPARANGNLRLVSFSAQDLPLIRWR